jgi:hypothetical protein
MAWALALFVFLAGVVCYAPITKYELYDSGPGVVASDIAFYVAMYQGKPLQDVERPYRYRVGTPWLAAQVPFLPDFLASRYTIDADKVIKFKFAVANMGLLVLTAMALWLWVPKLGFSPREALLTGLLFFGCFHVVVNAGTAMVEAGAYAGLAVGLLAAFGGPAWSFGLAFAVGLFFKETALLLLPAVALAFEGPRRWRLLAWAIPGLGVYTWFRLVAYPGGAGPQYSLDLAQRSLGYLVSPSFAAYVLVEFVLCFGPLWLLAGKGWRQTAPGHPLRRLMPMALLAVAAPFALHTVYGRVFFLSFPVVLPLAVLGLRELWPETAAVK